MLDRFVPGNGIVVIGQAIIGTLGVFFGMLVVYKTGAIRVTPKFTKWITGAIIGVGVLMLFNLVAELLHGAAASASATAARSRSSSAWSASASRRSAS